MRLSLSTLAAVAVIGTVSVFGQVAPAPQVKDSPLWAVISASNPVGEQGQLSKGTFMIHFALVNDGTQAVRPAVEDSQLFVNGKPHPKWEMTIGNGPRDARWQTLPAGDHLRFGYALGEWFEEPGVYTLVWKGKGFQSPEVTFRVLPRKK